MFDLRNISVYLPIVHSRYYIDTNGVVYTSISIGNNRVMVDGNSINVNKFRKENLSRLNTGQNIIMKIPHTNGLYFLKNDGIILKRLATRLDENNRVDVCLMRIGGFKSGNRYKIHRLMGYVFLGLTPDMEIHHIDNNPANNNIDNLKIMTFEEHRGKSNYIKNHKKLCNDYEIGDDYQFSAIYNNI